MKHLFTFLLVAISAISFAQGNLQFNQVLNFDYSATLSAYGNAPVGTLTVPPDKVWKITAASSRDLGPSHFSTSIAVNNHLLYEYRYVANSAAVSNNTPYWIGTGTHVVKLFNLYSSGISAAGSLSIIEFNVIP
ncbi:hypothetical protein N9J52_03715 [Flavobacteriales bacterium]|nr:hypothetical protein [Flavobacteriales bacterium]